MFKSSFLVAILPVSLFYTLNHPPMKDFTTVAEEIQRASQAEEVYTPQQHCTKTKASKVKKLDKNAEKPQIVCKK